MSQYILRNAVHGTETTVESADGTLPFKAARKLWKNLCGVKNCDCTQNPLFNTEPIVDAEGQVYVVEFLSSRGEIAGFRLVIADSGK
ncbi:hypothetical protein [Magnetofaba australis]|uniref:Uncharacterized protein n=1 Tax=Magnetofaba australis IT-1 TaxID=1434232 RepID=A0A1Y2K888_9PROT|nr:hypothetical protein [Magnetofaba australis]OSM06902.1 hypothetical protein MAIT1_00218 [Magnetofaba australis IT-1]